MTFSAAQIERLLNPLQAGIMITILVYRAYSEHVQPTAQ